MEKLQAALQGSRPVLMEFYATWCPHCQRMMPVMAELKDEMDGVAEIFQIEGDDNPELMDKFNVKGYPTFILYKDGQEVWRDSGEKPYSELKDMIDRFK
ncbi:MAG: thioredoxin family protein [Muribaculaceae bacterium]|jgi:thioredoxin 1|nr:thioredoxin family protein [Muribaculaceae bacterium]